MNEDCEVDLDWWKDAKATSLERKKAAVVPAALAAPGDSFLVVTEGRVTEPVYFDLLKGELQLVSMRVKVQPSDTSDARDIIKCAEREAKAQRSALRKGELANNEPAFFDHVWAVVDTDVPVRQGWWEEALNLAASLKVNLAHSTPCFEFWLLLHLSYTTRSDLLDGTTAKRVFQEELGQSYSTNKGETEAAIGSIVKQWPDAVVNAERVRRHHKECGTPPPPNPSTEVDRLVRALNDSAPEHRRRL